MANLYNLKMRSSKKDKHISGAERIIVKENIEEEAIKMIKRALNHSRGEADFINLSVSKVKDEITYLKSLPVSTLISKNYLEGRELIIKVLLFLGFKREKALKMLDILINAPSMRGAILLDINSLERLEPDKNRGIRATGMDYSSENIDIDNLHFREALALSTKVAHAPGIVAEICWSDDPFYTTGYIASKKYGYIRIPNLKPRGDEKGGRLFCFDSKAANLDECVHWIEKKIVLIDELAPNYGVRALEKVVGNHV